MMKKLSILQMLMFNILLLTGCGGDDSSTTPDANPEIISVSPTEGPTGTTVTIEGSGFSTTASENKVTFNGAKAQVNSATANQLETSVPEGTTSGPVKVRVGESFVTGPNFNIAEMMPGITSLEPDSGVVGTEVTIRGMNFSSMASENIITFNGGVIAPVGEASDTLLVTEVPEGSTSGPVEVSVEGKVTYSPTFTVASRAPQAFALLQPSDGAAGVELQPNFSWEAAADPDRDPVTYQLFLSHQSSPETMIATDQVANRFSLKSKLDYGQKYVWKVVAGDDRDGETESEVFTFTTRDIRGIQVTSGAGFPDRYGHTSEVFNGNIWITGGFGPWFSDVWFSSNGVTWQQATADAGFPGRAYHTSVVYDNKLWVIGGYANARFNDVWYSSDGETWTEATPNANFSPRYYHSSVVFDNKMWIIGGSSDSKYLNNDVWSSGVGITWTQATSSASFSARRGHSSVVFKDKIWVIGGTDNSGNNNDVWYSSDGLTWEQATDNAGFPGRYAHASVVFDDKLWIIGGRDGSDYMNDVWYSSDGENWIEATDDASYSERYLHASVVYNNRVWITGGNDNSSNLSDVWYLE